MKLNTVSAGNSPTESNDIQMKLLKELQKRVADLEKNFKVFSSTINIEQIFKEIGNLNEALHNKVEHVEFKEMKENYGKFLIDNVNYFKLNL